jgi:hypothetical protein
MNKQRVIKVLVKYAIPLLFMILTVPLVTGENMITWLSKYWYFPVFYLLGAASSDYFFDKEK